MKIRFYILSLLALVSQLSMAQLHIAETAKVHGLNHINTTAVSDNTETAVFVTSSSIKVVGLDQLIQANIKTNAAPQNSKNVRLVVTVPKQKIAKPKKKRKAKAKVTHHTTIKQSPFGGGLPFKGALLKNGLAAIAVVNTNVQQQHQKKRNTFNSNTSVVYCIYTLPQYCITTFSAIYNHTYTSETYANVLYSRPPPHDLV